MRTLLLLLLSLVAATAAHADERRDIGGLSYVQPTGWKSTGADASDHVQIQHAGSKYYCIISIYKSRAASGSLDDEFAAEWKSVGGDTANEPFKLSKRKIGKRTLAEAALSTVQSGTKVFKRIAVLDGGGQIATFIIFTPDAAAEKTYQKQIDAIIASVQFPSAAPPATTTQPATPPATSDEIVGTSKTSITLADLVGTWSYGAGAVTSYVDRSTGSHAGTDTVFYGESYAISANGAFTYKFTGRASNTTIRESDSGTIKLSGSTLFLQFKGSRGLKRFAFAAFVTQPDGTSVLTVFELGTPENERKFDPSHCAPYKGVISCSGGEQWVRAKK